MKGKNFSLNSNKRNKNDYYQTPYSMTKQLLEFENFDGKILEPSCGAGAIVKVLKDHSKSVDYCDLNNEFSLTGIFKNFKDFINDDFDRYDNIITNPPFSLAKEFILKAKQITNNKIAMLLPLNYLHGVTRYNEIYKDTKFPLKAVYVFCRYGLLEDTIREDGMYKAGMMVYAWYIWDKSYKGEPVIRWLNNNDYIVKSNKGS
ncbi:hypothetical protein DFW84_09670 [Campylobacter coli]|nr:hypothetical protein [Campylobacter coli]